MQAYVLTALDEPAAFCDVPVPSIGDRDVLIRVQATSVNPVDELVASGFFRTVQDYRFPAVFGRDFCGVVEAVGATVTRFSVGQVVWGFIKRSYIGDGTFAEFVSCPDDYFVTEKPEAIDVPGAGVLGLASITALECLDVLELGPGASVFVNRATGGVGSYAVQIAAARGHRVIATARPGSSESYVKALGATDVVDWTRDDMATSVRDLVPGGVDGVVDLVRRDNSAYIGLDESESQQATVDLATAVLRPGGRFSSVTNGATEEMVDRRIGFNVHSEPTPENLARINDLVTAGSLRSPITAAFPFRDIARAFDHQRRWGRGKTAVLLDPALGSPEIGRSDAWHPGERNDGRDTGAETAP